MPAMKMNLTNIESANLPLKKEEPQIYSVDYNSPLRPEERVRLLDQLDDKPLSFYRKEREAIYVSDLRDRLFYFDLKSWRNVLMQDELNLFLQDFNNFYSFDEIILPLPTHSRVNLLRYEMHPIGKKYTDKPNTLAILVFGNGSAFLIDRIGGFFSFLGIPKDLRGLNLKIAEDLNRSLIRIGREINLLSIRYRPHPLSPDVYDDHRAVA